MLKKLSLAVLVTVVIAASMAGLARGAMTITLGKPDLQAGILVVVPVTATCSPFDPSLTLITSSVFVQVEQAAKQQIAHGQAVVGGFMGATPFAFQCDGTPNLVSVSVLADVSGPPFHTGKAAFTVSAGASAGIPCGFPGCFTDVVGQSASLGPLIATMH